MLTFGLSKSQAFGVRKNTFAAACCWRGATVERPMIVCNLVFTMGTAIQTSDDKCFWNCEAGMAPDA